MGARRIADYTVLRELGRGGMGVVFQALSPAGVTVALKTVTWPEQADPRKRWQAIERFQREARAARALRHPNICRVLDCGAYEDCLFIVMEFLDGQTLRELIRSAGAIRTARAVEIAVSVCEALAYAHEHGVIHRDVKPENIMLLRSGEVKLMDFGLASVVSETTLADSGAVVGTLCYMSPEQVRGEGTQACSDVFSLGATFYEMLTGQRAFPGEQPAAVVNQILTVDPPPVAGQPEPVAEVLQRCLRKQPRERFQSARHMADALLGREPAPGLGRTELLTQPDSARRTMTPTPPPSGPLPPVWNVPHRRNPNFTGREEMLSTIEAALAAGGQAALTQAIVGLGGVGKTQLALEYAYRHAGEYQAIWWVRSEEPTQLAADYAALAGPLDLPEKAALDQTAAVAAVRRWLERNPGWLLIFDNAPGRAAVTDYVPRAGGGRVLITSRDQNWGATAAALEVPVLPQEEAVALLGKRTEWTGPEVGVLAEELGQLPLALEHAAAYAAATGCSVGTYLDLFRSRRRALLQRAKPPEGYQGTVTTTWSLAMAEAAAECPAAAGLLNLCAHLAPDQIPLSLVQEGAEFYPEPLAEAARDPLLLHDAVAALRRYSLVSVHQDALSVHRLVQAVVRDGMDEDEQRQWAALAVRFLTERFPTKIAVEMYDSRFWPIVDRFIPHALTAIELAMPFGTAEPAVEATSRLLGDVGWSTAARGEYEFARKCFARALEHFEKCFGPDHPDVVWLLQNYASFSEEPRPLRERMLALAEKAFGPEHEHVGNLRRELARAQCKEGDDLGAKASLERGVATLEQTVGPESEEVGWTRSALAYVLVRLGDLAAARAEAERVKAVFDKVFHSPDPARQLPANPARGWGHFILAYVLGQIGDFAGERENLECALEVYEQVFGTEHDRPMMCRGTIGFFSKLAFGDLPGAQTHVERALAFHETMLGPDHPWIFSTVAGLAQIRQFTGDLAGAKLLAERTLAVAEKAEERTQQSGFMGLLGLWVVDFNLTLVTQRPSTRAAHTLLASVLLDIGNLDAAQTHLGKALTMDRVIYGEWTGPDYEGVVEVFPTLGRLRRLQGRWDEAKACLEQSLATPEHLGPPHQWRLAATHQEYGLTLQEMGDLAGAREHLTQAVAMFELRVGPQHPRTENARRCLAALDAQCP